MIFAVVRELNYFIGFGRVDSSFKQTSYCSFCIQIPDNSKFKQLGLVVDHKFKEHNIVMPGFKIIQCTKCPYQTLLSFRMKGHIEEKHPKDDDSLVCKICDKKLGTVSSLELHIQTIHMGAKKHQCDKCDEVFTFSYQVFQTQ